MLLQYIVTGCFEIFCPAIDEKDQSRYHVITYTDRSSYIICYVDLTLDLIQARKNKPHLAGKKQPNSMGYPWESKEQKIKWRSFNKIHYYSFGLFKI